MTITQETIGLAILGGCAAGVAVGLAARYTPAFAVSQGETERDATGRLLARSGAAIAGVGIVVYVLGPSKSWGPVCLGALGAGSLLFVSGMTMSNEKLNLTLPKQKGVMDI